jgi:predicted DNA-binding antitoxin AbrB/MazE fold protein
MKHAAQERQQMTQSFQAVYTKGVLQPLEPVNLPENQQVTVTVINGRAELADDLFDHEFLAYCATQADDSVTIEEVRAALSKFKGSMSDLIRAERDED